MYCAISIHFCKTFKATTTSMSWLPVPSSDGAAGHSDDQTYSTTGGAIKHWVRTGHIYLLLICVGIPGVLVQSFVMNLAVLVLICSNLSVCIWITQRGAAFQCWSNKYVIRYMSYVTCTSI